MKIKIMIKIMIKMKKKIYINGLKIGLYIKVINNIFKKILFINNKI